MTSRSECMPAAGAVRAFVASMWPLGALLSLLGIYVALRPLAMHVDDSYAWVNTVGTQSFAFFFHPHHVLYLPLAWRWNQVVQAVAPAVSTWASLAALSAVFGCGGVAAVYATMRRLGARAGSAAAGAALPAFAFGYWFFASEPEVYVPSAACALWCMYFLTAFAERRSVRAAAWAGVAAGFAALFHQTGIFLFVPAAVVVWMMRSGGARTAIRASAAFTSAFAVVVAPVYVAAAWAAVPELTVSSFVRWLFLFAGEGYGGFQWSTLYGAPVGLLRALVGGQAVLDALRGAAKPGAVLMAGTVAAGAAGVLLVLLAVRSLRAIGNCGRTVRVVTVASIAVVAVYAAFGSYFDAANFEWWTIPVTLAVVACAPALTGPRPATRTAIVAVVALAIANLSLDFSYRRDPGNDIVLNAARTVAANTWSGDVVVAPSYLGAVLWYEDRSVGVVCLDEGERTAGREGMRKLLVAETLEAGRRGGRLIFAGVEGEGLAGRVRDTVLANVPVDAVEVVAGMHFFKGHSGLLRQVGQVPITAVDAAAAAEALLASNEGDAAR